LNVPLEAGSTPARILGQTGSPFPRTLHKVEPGPARYFQKGPEELNLAQVQAINAMVILGQVRTINTMMQVLSVNAMAILSSLSQPNEAYSMALEEQEKYPEETNTAAPGSHDLSRRPVNRLPMLAWFETRGFFVQRNRGDTNDREAAFSFVTLISLWAFSELTINHRKQLN
jgi:hypothetical protein